MTEARLGSVHKAAALLGISPQTHKNLTWSLRGKLGARTNLQAYAMLSKGVRVVTTTEIKLEPTE